jgi:outer membrane cobalamin receptor
MKKLLLLFSLLLSSQLYSQLVVSGKITDKLTKLPIIGAYVIDVNDPSYGGVSDLDGHYSLSLPAGSHQLLFKYTGMVNDTVFIKGVNDPNIIVNVELSPKTLNTIDIVVGKFDKKVEELTFSMEVIKPDLIENKNTRSIESILDQTPGLNIMDGEPQIRGGSGFTFGVGSKVSVLVDDMPMLSGDAGRPEWSFIPVENIEQIEITKGASSVLSGSSALSGSIHIRTAYPKAKPLTKINIYSGFYSQPQGDSANWWGKEYPFIHGMNFLHSRIIKKYTDLVIGGNLNWDHGYIGGPIKGEDVFDTLSEEFTNKQMQHKKARLNFNLRRRSKRYKGLQFGINGNFMVHKTNLVLAWLDDSSGIYRAYPGAALLQDQIIFNVDPYVEFYSKIGVKHSLKTRMMYSSNEMTGNQSNLAKVYYADYQFKKEFNFLKDKSFDFIGGLSTQYNDSDAELYTGEYGDGSNDLFNLSAYAEVQKDLFKVINFSFGARAEYYKLNDTITQWKPIFRTGANLKLGQATFLRASYGQGYRFPTITERYIRTAVGSFGVFDNPDILPEESWNAEVGVNQGFKIGNNYMGQIDVAAFLQHYENTIEYLFGFWDPDPNPFVGEPLAGFKFLNTGKSQISGFDITVNGQAKIGKHFILTHAVGYNYINPVTLEPDLVFATDYNFGTPQDFSFRSTSVDTTTNTLKYRFKHTFKADVEIKYKKFAIGYTIKYFSKMENLDKAISEFENITVNTGGTLQAVLYQDFYEENKNGNIVMDLRASYGFGDKTKHKFSLVSKNLTNSLYSLRPLKVEAMRSTVLQYTFSF